MADEGSVVSTSFRPDESDRENLSGTYRQARYVAFGILAVTLVAIVYALIGVFSARAFAQGGDLTQAHVVARVHGRYINQIHVVYTTGHGDVDDVRIPVDNVDEFQPGTSILIEVDPNNPRHARTREGWTPPYQVPIIVAVISLLLTLALLVGVERWSRRIWKTASTGQPHQILLSWITIPGPRGARFWRALIWNPAHPPPAAPILQLRVNEPGDAVGVVEPATAYGDLEHRKVVVLRDSSGFLWPQSRARRPNRSVLKALAQAPVAVAPPEVAPAPDPGLPVPAMEQTTAGGLPPLPPEFFQKQKPKKSRNAATTIARIVAALVIVLGIPFVASSFSSKRNACPSLPPASSLRTAVRPSTNAQLLALIRQLPRPEDFIERDTRVLKADDLTLPAGGYQAGIEVAFRRPNGDVLGLEMLQFDSNENAVRHWAGTWVNACAFRHTNFAAAGDPSARGISVSIRTGGFDQRLYTVRYGRLYMVVLFTQQPAIDQLQSEFSAVQRSNL